MRKNKVWPTGERYLWTDAHGVILCVSLFKQTGDERFLREAEFVVKEVKRVLGRRIGYRIGEAASRDGQYFHYLTKWMFALCKLGDIKIEYKNEAIQLAKQIHSKFFVPDVGFYWKMKEDLSARYPGYGIGGLDVYDAYVMYRLLSPVELKKRNKTN